MSVPLHKMVDGVQVPLTQEETDDFYRREKEYNEKKALFGYLDSRNAEYPKEWEKVEAMWALLSKNDSTLLDQLKKRISEVDAKYPAPT